VIKTLVGNGIKFATLIFLQYTMHSID